MVERSGGLIVSGGQRDSPEVKRFRTYLNYLDAYCRAVREAHADWDGYSDACLRKTSGIQGKKSNHDWVERYLPIAWNTEHLIHEAPNDNPELLRIANHWLPVQTYYALYCGAEAAGAVLDGNPPNGHAAALRALTAYLLNLGVSPWDLGVEGARGRDGSAAKSRNLPAGVRIPHNLEIGSEPIGMLGKCLLSEHRHRVDDRWKSKKESGGYKYQYDPGCTGLLHFFYRLRVKANYKDVDLFLAAVSDADVMRFTDALRTVTLTGMTLFEVLVMRRLGKRYLMELGSAYLKKNSGAKKLSRRLDAYRLKG